MKLIRLVIIMLVTATLAALAQDVSYTSNVNQHSGVFTGVFTGYQAGTPISPPPPGTCNGTIDLSTGCMQPMLGGL